MIHDMLVGAEHLVFVVPPVQYDFMGLAAGAAAADVLHYMENNSTRLIVIRKDGTGDPVIFNQPPGMVYHHGNLFENGNSLWAIQATYLSLSEVRNTRQKGRLRKGKQV